MFLIAVILTYMAIFTGIDLFSLVRLPERNRLFLYLGGSFSIGIGIWIMQFIGMVAININNSIEYNIFLTVYSIFFGIAFVTVAFLGIVLREVDLFQILKAGFFVMIAEISIHIIVMFALDLQITYNIFYVLFTASLCFSLFCFSIYVGFHPKQKVVDNKLRKVVSSLIFTVAITLGYFLFLDASMPTNDNQVQALLSSSQLFLLYLALFVALLTLALIFASRTILKSNEEKQQVNVNELKTAFDTTFITVTCDKYGIISHVNDKFVEKTNYSRSDILGVSLESVLSPTYPIDYFQEMESDLEIGETWKGDLCIKRADGQLLWVNSTVVPNMKEGMLNSYVLIFSEITLQKKTEEDLIRTTKNLEDIEFALDQSAIVAFTDPKGIITHVNDKFCKISQYPKEDIIGRTHSFLNSNYHGPEFFGDMWKTIKKGKVWKGEICNKNRSGKYYWVATTIVPFLNKKGEPYQYLAIRYDITQRKIQEEMLHRQDKLAAVGELATGVAHEIRNPLTSIRGYSEFLATEETNPEKKEIFNIILEEIDRLNEIVEDFMMFSKPNSVKMTEKNIVKIVENMVKFYELEASKKKVFISFASQKEEILINCDENRLKQVFINIVKNAIEAMPDGGYLSIEIEINHGYVEVSFNDTGSGIPEDLINRLGEPFLTTKSKGNGLGLMISKNIIENHGGKISIESEMNVGTTFKIQFPYFQ